MATLAAALVGAALSQVRGAKSDAKVSMRADVPSAVITGPGADLDRLSHAAADLAAAGRIIDLTFEATGDDTDLKAPSPSRRPHQPSAARPRDPTSR